MRAKRLGGFALLIELTLGCGRTTHSAGSSGSSGDVAVPPGGGSAFGGEGPAGGEAVVGGEPAVGEEPTFGGGTSLPHLGPAGGTPLGSGTPEPDMLPAGTCGVLRAIQPPSDVEARQAVVTRQAGGFAIGPWKSGALGDVIDGLFIDSTGRKHTDFTAHGTSSDVAWSVLMADRRLVVDVYVAPGAASPLDAFNTRFWANGNHAPTERGTLLAASWRGTDYVLTQPSLDGKSAVFALWPTGIAEPQAAVIGTDGARVGMPQSLGPPDHQFGKCQVVVPTLDGGIVSYFDPDNVALRLSRLGADGARSLDLAWPLLGEPHACPLFALRDAGFGFLVDDAAEGESPQFRINYVAADGSGLEAPIAFASSPLAWTTTSAGLLFLEQGPAGYSLELKPEAGPPRIFPLPSLSAQLRPVLGEAGSIYVDSGGSDEPRTLLELTCR